VNVVNADSKCCCRISRAKGVDITNCADSREAWKEKEHASLFGGWDYNSTAKLVKLCNQFNEFQLFRTLAGNPDCRTLSDVGCATGNFYRFFQKVWPALKYKGFDISEAAIERAKSRYPTVEFSVFDGRLKSLRDIESDIVFCRDVVHHQANPCEFLADLYDISSRYLILRVRTREVGTTVFDLSQSCQYVYGHWVPHIVFNTSELINLVRAFKPSPAKITLRRHPVILGGQNSRFLPKELYYPETGSAETALVIAKGEGRENGNTVVILETWPEVHEQPRRALWLRRLAQRWGL
jgi:SAM-dependent methyltransferase